MREAIEERNLQNFAQGLKEASELYKQPLESIAVDVAKYAPYKLTIAAAIE
jgi:hypothetical protein